MTCRHRSSLHRLRLFIAAFVILAGAAMVFWQRTHSPLAPPRTAAGLAISSPREDVKSSAAHSSSFASPSIQVPGYASLAEAIKQARLAVSPLDPTASGSRGALYFAHNPAQRLRAWFREDGIELAGGHPGKQSPAPHQETTASSARPLREDGWSVALRLQAAGREGAMVAPRARSVRATAGLVTLGDRASGLTEWYANQEDAFEQGFTFDSPPPGSDARVPLQIILAVSGTLHATAVDDTSIHFVDPEGQEKLRYSDLRAWDATGRSLPARLEPRGAQGKELALVVHDLGAQYPVTVDPIFADPEATLKEEVGQYGEFGSAVAVSGDTATVSAVYEAAPDGTSRGVVYVFKRENMSWHREARLAAPDAASNFGTPVLNFGNSVALDRDTLLIQGEETTFVYTRTQSTTQIFWTLQVALPVPGSRFGPVAIVGDTAIIGAPQADPNGDGTLSSVGAVYIFSRTGALWEQQAMLKASAALGGAAFGTSLAFSGDTLLVGATGESASEATAYAFVRTVSGWSEQARLATSGRSSFVALSGDTALVGSPEGGTKGVATIFRRIGSTWSPEQDLETVGSGFGASVALVGDTALVGDLADGTPSLYVRDSVSARWLPQPFISGGSVFTTPLHGGEIALDGATAILGDAGSAYVFARGEAGWTKQAKLISNSPSTADDLGNSVAIDLDRVIVGAPEDDTEAGVWAGSALIFARENGLWHQEAKLTASDGMAGDHFGTSASIDGTTVAIGAPYHILNGVQIGQVYVYVREGDIWSYQDKLQPDQATGGDSFGGSVSVSGDTALVGALPPGPGAPISANPLGAYVFVRKRGHWTKQQILETSRSTAVALSGNTALIGNPGKNGSGVAYVYVREEKTWRLEAELKASPPVASQLFGFSVALDGNTAIVGAPHSTLDGHAYIFVRTAGLWAPQATLDIHDSPATDAQFGYAVALRGDTALVGAPFKTSAALGDDVGAAYVFTKVGAFWNPQKTLNGAHAKSYFSRAVGVDSGTAVVTAPGIDSASIFLLGATPEITAQPPAETTVVPGKTVTLSATATGYTPLHYQWRKNGVEIATAAGTSTVSPFFPTISFQSAELQDGGFYDVVITNLGGYVTSSPARLTVNDVSDFERVLPSAAPKPNGYLIVNLWPSDIGGAWRFVGEKQWRPPGIPVAGLPTCQRSIEFRAVAGFLQPVRELVEIISDAPARLLDAEYYETPDTGTGTLSVTLKPASLTYATLPAGQRAQWRLLGEDDSHWRESGAPATGLYAGSYLVECKPVAGHTTPTPVSVAVAADGGTTAFATYYLASTPTGIQPEALSSEAISASNGDLTYPYPFIGQLRSTAGSGTGTVVKPRVVATAAHVVFDDATLSAVVDLEWLLQRDNGNNEPVPVPARGYYAFAGYATQRAVEQTPGISTSASQTLDVAAAYFLSNVARGGSSGFVASDSEDNEWLLSPRLKMLVGYPTSGVSVANQGRMHATAAAKLTFRKHTSRTFISTDFSAVGGASGGPLCVQYDDGHYYPAAIYLGGSAQSVVRAIDGEVAHLFENAQAASTGQNHVDSGQVQVELSPSLGALPSAQLDVILSPAEVIATATWQLGSRGSARHSGALVDYLPSGRCTLYFSPVPGYEAPDPLTLTLESGRLTTVHGQYLPSRRPRITLPHTIHLIRGVAASIPVQAAPQASRFAAAELPIAGLSLDATTGLLSGTPLANGSFSFILKARNAAGWSDPFTITIVVSDPGTLITGTLSPGGIVTVHPIRRGGIYPQGETITLQAKPLSRAFLFAGWEISGVEVASTSSSTISFSMTERVVANARFVPSPFTAAAGTYRGLLEKPGNIPCGIVNCTVSTTGKFTLHFTTNTGRRTLQASFDSSGHFSGASTDAKSVIVPVILSLALDPSNRRLRGTVFYDGETCTVDAIPTIGRPESASLRARYTIALLRDPAQLNPSTYPFGHGYATMVVDRFGNVRASGQLGDGTPFSFGGSCGSDLQWRLYARPYPGGSLAGALAFTSMPPSMRFDLSGSLRWVKMPSSTAAFPGGFLGTTQVVGSTYIPPPPGGLPPLVNGWNLRLGDDVLPQPASATVTLAPDNQFRFQAKTGGSFALRLEPQNGLLSGTLRPETGKTLLFKGVLLPSRSFGRGLFKTSIQTGPLNIDPPTSP